jgi:hypothetical protein
MFLGSKVPLVRGADNLTATDCLDNVRSVTSHNPIGLHGLLGGYLLFLLFLGYKPEGRGFETRWGEILNLPNPSGRMGFTQPLTEISTGNIKKKNFWGVKYGWCVGLKTLPPPMSRLSRQCGILNISQSYRPPRPVTGIALLFYQYRSYEGC